MWDTDDIRKVCTKTAIVKTTVTRGATVTGCAPVVSFFCKGLYYYDKQSLNATKNTERLKFQDFNICPNILHVDADVDASTDADASMDADAGGIAIALLHLSAGALKRKKKCPCLILKFSFLPSGPWANSELLKYNYI